MTCATDRGSNPTKIATADSSPSNHELVPVKDAAFNRRRGHMPLLTRGDASPIISLFYSDFATTRITFHKDRHQLSDGAGGVQNRVLSYPSPHINFFFSPDRRHHPTYPGITPAAWCSLYPYTILSLATHLADGIFLSAWPVSDLACRVRHSLFGPDIQHATANTTWGVTTAFREFGGVSWTIL